MKKSHLKFMLLSVTLCVLVLFNLVAGCTPAKDESVREEVVYAFTQLNETALGAIDDEVDVVGDKRFEVMIRTLKLRQIVTPALEWMELQSEDLPQKHTSGSWRVEVTDEGLTQFQNDFYKIVSLEYQARDIGEKNQSFVPVIRVTDISSNRQYEADVIFQELEKEKLDLDKQAITLGEKRYISALALYGVIKHWQEWAIAKIGETTFSVSGPGLGIDQDTLDALDRDIEEKLSAGKWTYNTDTGEILPGGNESSALEKVLLAEFK